MSYGYILVFCLVFHGFPFAIFAGPQEPSPAERIRAGNRALDVNRLDEAVSIFSQLAAENRDLASAHQGLGIALLRRGELQRARTSLLRAVEIDTQLPKTRFLLGLAYFGLGNPLQAKHEFEQQLKQSPRDKQTLLFLARTWLLLGNAADSVQILKRALEVDDTDPDTLWMLAEHDPSHASEYAAKLLSVAPDSQQADHWLAEMHRRKGELPAAAEKYRAAVAKAPDMAGLHLGLARVQSEMADYDGAIQSANAELKVHPYSGAAHILLSSLLLLNGSFEEAASHAQAAIGLQHRPADAHLLLGRARVGMNDWTGAAQEFEQAIALNPHLRDAHYKLASVYTRLGREAAARASLEKFRSMEK